MPLPHGRQVRVIGKQRLPVIHIPNHPESHFFQHIPAGPVWLQPLVNSKESAGIIGECKSCVVEIIISFMRGFSIAGKGPAMIPVLPRESFRLKIMPPSPDNAGLLL